MGVVCLIECIKTITTQSEIDDICEANIFMVCRPDVSYIYIYMQHVNVAWIESFLFLSI